MLQRAPAPRLLHRSEKVEIEKIFPRFSPQRAGFDLGQIDIAQGKSAEAPEQGAGNIAGRENDRRFPTLRAAAPGRGLARQQEKSGKVLAIVLDRAFQDLSAVVFGSRSGGDGGGSIGRLFHDHLYAARRIVVRFTFYLRMFLKETE